MTSGNESRARSVGSRRARTIGTAGLLLALVATAVSGCVFVPVPGWGGGYHHHHHGYYHGY